MLLLSVIAHGSPMLIKGLDSALVACTDMLGSNARPMFCAQVWGSWWSGGQWGYACCHQSVKNSYCTGSAGETAAQEAAEQMQANLDARAREAQAPDADVAAASTSAAVRPLQSLPASEGAGTANISMDGGGRARHCPSAACCRVKDF